MNDDEVNIWGIDIEVGDRVRLIAGSPVLALVERIDAPQDHHHEDGIWSRLGTFLFDGDASVEFAEFAEDNLDDDGRADLVIADASMYTVVRRVSVPATDLDPGTAAILARISALNAEAARDARIITVGPVEDGALADPDKVVKVTVGGPSRFMHETLYLDREQVRSLVHQLADFLDDSRTIGVS